MDGMTPKERISLPVVVAALVAVLFLLSMRYRFLDQFVIGAWHGNLGADFFSVPRAFLNLRAGHSMFDTGFTEYGPYATAFFFHPAVAVLFGSWLSLFDPWTAFALFVVVSLGLLAFAASLFAKELRTAYLCIICSFPVYLMLWNAQLHVFTVVAWCLTLSGMLDLSRQETAPWAGGKICAGLLVSLLTKPMIMLVIPYLLLVKRARRATLLALAGYGVISLVCIVVPFLNPQGDALTHWTNIVRESATIKSTKVELFSLPTYVNLIAGSEMLSGQAVKLPLLVALLPLLGGLKLKASHDRALMAILGMSLVLASYYLAYTTVWEYHYATVFSMVPVLLILSRTRMLQVHPVSQALFLAALLFLYLPTPCVFFRHKVAYVFEWITLCRSFRVLPVLVLYGVLFVETLRFMLQRLALQTGETN